MGMTEIIMKDDRWYWPSGVEGDNSWNHQQLSANLFSKIKPHLKGNGTMVQAGGNCGFVLSQFVDHFRHVYTFEPEPTNFLCLCMNILEPHVVKMQACIGNDCGLVGLSSEIPDIGAFHVAGGLPHIPCIKIDTLNLSDCNLIQLDVEGFEFAALLGAKETIKKFGPVICAEWYEPWANRFGVKRHMWEDFFKEMKYTHVCSDGNDEIYVRQ